MTSKRLVLVTGASGFVGAQAVEHLLQAGYAVRGTSRSGKAEELRRSYSNPNFEVVVVEDLTTGDLFQALQGVYAVVHIASPLPTIDVDVVQVAVNSTLNVLRQAYAARIYKYVIMSSAFGAVDSLERFHDPWLTIKPTDWWDITIDEARKLDPVAAYSASKAISESAAWEFAESHSEVDLTTLLPPFIYGPIAPGHVVQDPRTMLSSDLFLYMLVGGPQAAYPPAGLPTQFADVRDVSRAIVAALGAGPAPAGEKKRILLGGGSFRWTDAVRHLAAARPELKPRMVDRGVPVDGTPLEVASLDVSQARDVLGVTDWITYGKSVEDTVDSILKRESEWIQ